MPRRGFTLADLLIPHRVSARPAEVERSLKSLSYFATRHEGGDSSVVGQLPSSFNRSIQKLNQCSGATALAMKSVVRNVKMYACRNATNTSSTRMSRLSSVTGVPIPI